MHVHVEGTSRPTVLLHRRIPLAHEQQVHALLLLPNRLADVIDPAQQRRVALDEGDLAVGVQAPQLLDDRGRLGLVAADQVDARGLRVAHEGARGGFADAAGSAGLVVLSVEFSGINGEMEIGWHTEHGDETGPVEAGDGGIALSHGVESGHLACYGRRERRKKRAGRLSWDLCQTTCYLLRGSNPAALQTGADWLNPVIQAPA